MGKVESKLPCSVILSGLTLLITFEVTVMSSVGILSIIYKFIDFTQMD